MQAVLKNTKQLFRPPPKLTISEWADKYRKLSPESSAESGSWYTSRCEYQREIMDTFNDPGVESVKKIYHYFKKYNLNTVVMAASFRNTSQIIELAGCDKLTISTALLEELSSTHEEITQKLKSEDSPSLEIERIKINESAFRWHLNENQMASFKLAEGIRLFNKDLSKLRDLIFNQI